MSCSRLIVLVFAVSAVSLVQGMDTAGVEARKKHYGLYFAPLTTLLIIKMKKIFLALLVLFGTAVTTKFIAGLVHLFGYKKCSCPVLKPTYSKGVYYDPPHKYETPTYWKQNDFDGTYDTDSPYQFYKKRYGSS